MAALLVTGMAQAQFFEKGTSVVSAGIGLGSAIGSFNYGSQSPGISLQYEKGVWDIGGPGVISLGGYAARKGYKYSGSSGSFGYEEKWNYTIIGVRSAYHYNGISAEKADLYGGIMLSYNILNYKYSDNSGSGTLQKGSYGNALGFTAYVGGRYLFTDNLGAFVELGYGVSYLTLGLALKF
jgi:hypothetical protein